MINNELEKLYKDQENLINIRNKINILRDEIDLKNYQDLNNDNNLKVKINRLFDNIEEDCSYEIRKCNFRIEEEEKNE